MNDVAAILDPFVIAYRSRAVPPPHILLTGPDRGRCEQIARNFAAKLGFPFNGYNAANLRILVDLNPMYTHGGIAFLSNIHHLKKPVSEKLVGDLVAGEFDVLIGKGPGARSYKLDIGRLTVIAAVPAKYDCPSALFKVFETVITIDPPTNEELVGMLAQEAWKGRISLERDAAELLVRASGSRSEILFTQFRRICEIIEQIKATNKPHLTKQEVQDALERLRIKIPSAIPSGTILDINNLSGQDFERLIKSLLMEMGFEAELTQVTGDGGIDIIAKLDKPFTGGRYLFQCKRYANSLVGAPEVRDFYGAVTADRAMKGVFITTSDFTAQAKEFGAQSGIELVNLSKLLQLLSAHGLEKYV